MGPRPFGLWALKFKKVPDGRVESPFPRIRRNYCWKEVQGFGLNEFLTAIGGSCHSWSDMRLGHVTCLDFLASSPQKSRCLDVVPLDLGIGMASAYSHIEVWRWIFLIKFRSLPGGCCWDLICRSFVGFVGYLINFNCFKRLLQDPCLQSVW